MAKHILLFSFFMVFIGSAGAQTFLQALQAELAVSFGLPSGTVVTNPDEAQVLAEAFTYGVTREDFLVQGEIFTDALRMISPTRLGEVFDHAGVIQTTASIAAGDKLLFVCYVRAENTLGDQSVIQVWAEENGGNFEKYGGGIVYPTDEWQRFLIPFEAPTDFAIGDLQMPFQIGFLTQTIEIAGAVLFNYGMDVTLDDLPNERAPTAYLGQSPNAAWRAQAANQIDQNRKADLTVLVTDLNGNPLSGQEVSISMQKHDFGFGSAVVSCYVDGLRCADATYEGKMRDIDGQGHRFNEVVFENDLKWNAWEQAWFESQEGVAQALAFYRDTLGMNVRGHTLLWPCEGTIPADIEANLSDTSFVLGRIRDHFSDILSYPGIAGKIQDWDLLNEVAVCNEIAGAFAGLPGYTTGREFYPSLYRLAKTIDPEAEYWYNDYQVIQQGGFASNRRQAFYDRANELLNAGAPLAGVGLQSHVEYPVPPVRIIELFDEVYDSIGLPMKVTEFDMFEFANEQLEADFFRDFLTVTFAHPHTEAFLSWGFWDGAHFRESAPFFRRDWTVKPSGQAFFDLVYNDWWTEETITTDANGRANVRGFKGDYLIEVSGKELDINLVDDLEVTVIVATSRTREVELSLKPEVRPNPSSLAWNLSHMPADEEVRLYDSRGRLVAFAKTDHIGQVNFSAIDLAKGVYLAKVGAYAIRLIKQ